MARPTNPVPRSNYITPEGAKSLRNELDFLWRSERPQVTQQVSDAAAMGDRSENAEYIYGKKRLREIDRRIRFLSKRLEALAVVSEPPGNPGKVYFGAWVRLEDEQGTESTYRLVGPDEISTEAGHISIDSPVGRALLGREEGDEVIVRRPAGAAAFTVLDVSYRPFPE
ncbi:MAG TPA: transcription elongation factor GreB [Desulfuromonadales bacterium]|nr:transcription elongation factor GreB [Desulfuromonadales bacterium]